MKNIAVGIVLMVSMCIAGASAAQDTKPKTKTIDVPFTSHDGYPMFGKLTLPEAGAGYPVVIYVQTAEGMTVDMKRSNGRGGTFITGNLPDRHKAIFEFINDHVRKK